MDDDKQRTIIPSKGGMFQELGLRIKLILRLMSDPRVSPLLKLLPVGSLVYLVVPDLVLGPLDDAAVIWLGTVLFVEMCPPEIVKEHMDALRSVVSSEWRDVPPQEPEIKAEDIVDAEYWDADKPGKPGDPKDSQ